LSPAQAILSQVIHTYPSNILSFPKYILLDIRVSFWYP
jgi:hypothetical protein